MNRLIQATAFFLKRQQRCPRGTHSRLFLPPYLGTHWSNPHQTSASNSGSRSKGLGNHFYRSAQTGCPNACSLPDVKGLLNLSEPPLPVSRKAHCGKLKGSTRKIEKSMASSPRRSLETDTQEKRTYSELMFAGFLHIAELGGEGGFPIWQEAALAISQGASRPQHLSLGPGHLPSARLKRSSNCWEAL